jgi:hypothetical protein
MINKLKFFINKVFNKKEIDNALQLLASYQEPKLVRAKMEKRRTMRVTGVFNPLVGHYNLISF